MKKALLIIIAASAFFPLCMHAQSGLNINKIFTDHYRDMKGATETMVVKDQLRNMNLSLYHSITFKDHPELGGTIERLVAADGAKAASKEVRYKNGHLYYGFYSLGATAGGLNRYIIYLNGHLNGDNRIMLLFLEGKAKSEQVKKMLK